jgi:hypothetical protein
MNWPPDPTCKRIASLRALAIGSSNLSEKANASAALKRLQCQFDHHSAQVSEHPLNPLEVILGLFETHHTFLSLMQQIVVTLWPCTHMCASNSCTARGPQNECAGPVWSGASA